MPLYLSIEFFESDAFYADLDKLILEHLFDQIIAKHPENKIVEELRLLFHTTLLQDLPTQGGQGKWHFPENFHVTCLYMGRQKEKKQNHIFKNFRPGQAERVEIKALLFSPGNIITAVA